MLASPLSLELGRSEVHQRGMDTLVHVNVIEEMTNLINGISIIHVLR